MNYVSKLCCITVLLTIGINIGHNASAQESTVMSHPTEQSDVVLDSPELRASIQNAAPAIVSEVLKKADPQKNSNQVFTRVEMLGGKVLAVKTYPTQEALEKAIEKDREKTERETAKRKAKRGEQTRAQMIQGLTRVPPQTLPAATETQPMQSAMFSHFIGRQVDLRWLDGYMRDYDTANPGDMYAVAEYADYTSRQFLGEENGVTAISTAVIRTMFRKDETKGFTIDAFAYFIDPSNHTISIARSEDIDINNPKDFFNYKKYLLDPTDKNYEVAKLMYKDLTGKHFN